MSSLTIKERQALKYAIAKSDGDRDIRAAQAHMHAASSTPSLQHWFEDRFGWLVVLFVGFGIAALTACANQAERHHQPTSLAESKVACVRQKQTVVVGHTRYGQPVVLFTDGPCKAKP